MPDQACSTSGGRGESRSSSSDTPVECQISHAATWLVARSALSIISGLPCSQPELSPGYPGGRPRNAAGKVQLATIQAHWGARNPALFAGSPGPGSDGPIV